MAAHDDRAIVVGSGPNGLAAAVTLARAGLEVTVLERADHFGGGTATRELTLPGFRHDVCSAVHPMAAASDFFTRFGLARRIELLTPEISYAQPLGTGVHDAAVAYRDLDRTADGLGSDGAAWRRLLGPLAARPDAIAGLLGAPVLGRRPIAELPTAARFALRALAQGGSAWNRGFRGEAAPALLTGVFAHGIQPLPGLGSAAAGLVLAALAHAGGWPVPRGGSGAIADALVADLLVHGGRVEAGIDVRDLDQLGDAGTIMLDVTPRALAAMAGERMPARAARALRAFRYGDGVAKVDYALSGPVPWTAPELRQAVTVHLGGTRAELARAEAQVAAGRHPEHPYVLVTQPTVLDPSRAPAGGHVLWAYTHVPAGSAADREQAITARIEQFAPGFRELVLASSSRSAAELERRNPNYVGGDIGAGAASARQLVARPRLGSDPWRTALPGVYLCSASTAPGPGVHGQAGWLAARRALARLGRPVPELGPQPGSERGVDSAPPG